MKNTKMLYNKQKDHSNDYEEVVVIICSEPYPKIGSSYGSPRNSGATYSSTHSTTCVSVQVEGSNEYLHDVAVYDLKPYIEPVVLSDFLYEHRITKQMLDSYYNHLQDTHQLEANIKEYNTCVEEFYQQILNCMPSKLPCESRYLEDYFGGLPYFLEVDKPYFREIPAVVFETGEAFVFDDNLRTTCVFDKETFGASNNIKDGIVFYGLPSKIMYHDGISSEYTTWFLEYFSEQTIYSPERYITEEQRNTLLNVKAFCEGVK